MHPFARNLLPMNFTEFLDPNYMGKVIWTHAVSKGLVLHKYCGTLLFLLCLKAYLFTHTRASMRGSGVSAHQRDLVTKY